MSGVLKHRCQLGRRGRKRYPALRLPPGLQLGIVHTKRGDKGDLLSVRTYVPFGRLRDIHRPIRDLGKGPKVSNLALPGEVGDHERCRLAPVTSVGVLARSA